MDLRETKKGEVVDGGHPDRMMRRGEVMKEVVRDSHGACKPFDRGPLDAGPEIVLEEARIGQHRRPRELMFEKIAAPGCRTGTGSKKAEIELPVTGKQGAHLIQGGVTYAGEGRVQNAA